MIHIIKNYKRIEALYLEGSLIDVGSPLSDSTLNVVHSYQMHHRYGRNNEGVKVGYSNCEEFPSQISELEDIIWLDNSV